MSAVHTPGPWHSFVYGETEDADGNVRTLAEVRDEHDQMLAERCWQEDADRIVQCCNTHDELVDVLGAMADYFGGAKDRLGRPDAVANDAMRAARDRILKLAVRYEVASAHTIIDQCAQVMRAALAKVEGNAS